MESSTEISLWKKTIFSILPTIAILGLLLGLELFLRQRSPHQRWKHAQQFAIDVGWSESEQIFEYDQDLFWKLRKNVILPVTEGLWWGRISDARGYRSPNYDWVNKGKKTIIALGDSTTFSVGVDIETSWPNQLERILNAENVSVLNAGVPGYTSHQGLVLLEKLMAQVEPAMVIVSFGNNDASYWGGYTDHEMSSLIRRSNFIDSALIRWLQGMIYGERKSETHWHGNELKNTGRSPARVPLQRFRENMESMIKMVKNGGGSIALMLWPFQSAILGGKNPRYRYHDLLYSIGDQYQVPVIDLTEPFRESGLGGKLYLDELHGAGPSMGIAADYIGQQLKREGWLNGSQSSPDLNLPDAVEPYVNSEP